ncbi:hypothetical protein GCM10011380_00830 [Sphingomonas metalli]|uniref:Calx-beta domain-containing protein n=1 Tax=Sphingomonas metalli TaxID=1779358 RepID=A0A916WMP0_9SPHN|nr:Calx-beta domain-containing protein [Sphingomonas metalli]GGB15236.1 hypothetical protein GCM10011380_00830 [Sphingomonas metalli]
MIGLRRFGRLKLGLRLGGVPVVGPTLDNTRGDTTAYQAQDIQGFSARHAAIRTTLASLGVTVSSNLARLPQAVFDELDAALTTLENPVPTPQPSISFDSGTANVAEGQTVASTLTVTRNGATGPLTVNLATSGTATSGTDYTALSATLTIPDGQNSVSFDVVTSDDSAVEGDETIVVTATLAGYSGYAGVSASKTITITDATDRQPSAHWGPFNLSAGQTETYPTTSTSQTTVFATASAQIDCDIYIPYDGAGNYNRAYFTNTNIRVEAYRNGGFITALNQAWDYGPPAQGTVVQISGRPDGGRIIVGSLDFNIPFGGFPGAPTQVLVAANNAITALTIDAD